MDFHAVGTLRRLARPTRTKLVVGSLLLALGLALHWWFDGGRWLFFPRHFGVVEEAVIYRSGQLHPRVLDGVIEAHGIRTIIDLSSGEERNESRRHEREVAERMGVRLVELITLDGSGDGDLEDYVVALTEMVAAHRTGVPVLVHCSSGTQRTGAATAWYRMLVDGWTGERAYREYMSYRYNRPDSGTLVRYVNGNMARLIERLVETGALAQAIEPLPRFGPGTPEE